MPKMTYWEQLNDPRWQRRRLEIMSRDKFTCTDCRDATTKLNVHHTSYKKGVMVWEYGDSELKTLCEPCHAKLTKDIQQLNHLAGLVPHEEMQAILGYTLGVAVYHVQATRVYIRPGSERFLQGFAAAYCLAWDDAEILHTYGAIDEDRTTSHAKVMEAIEAFDRERAEVRERLSITAGN